MNKATSRRNSDGLNSIKYKIAQIKVSKLYTKVIVIYSKTELTAKFKSKN